MTQPEQPADPADIKKIEQAEIVDERTVSPDQLRLELGEFFEGPLPPAAELRAYADIPGALDMIHEIAMAPYDLSAKALDHQHDVAKVNAQARADIAGRGQRYSLIIALSGLVIALLLGIFVSSAAAIVIGAIDLVGLASVPLINRRTSTPPVQQKTPAELEKPTAEADNKDED